METLYDVIVVGGGTAGCAVSYMSAKLGLKVLLIERGIHLGGTIMTICQFIKACHLVAVGVPLDLVTILWLY